MPSILSPAKVPIRTHPPSHSFVSRIGLLNRCNNLSNSTKFFSFLAYLTCRLDNTCYPKVSHTSHRIQREIYRIIIIKPFLAIFTVPLFLRFSILSLKLFA